jgi:hypothetical protein
MTVTYVNSRQTFLRFRFKHKSRHFPPFPWEEGQTGELSTESTAATRSIFAAESPKKCVSPATDNSFDAPKTEIETFSRRLSVSSKLKHRGDCIRQFYDSPRFCVESFSSYRFLGIIQTAKCNAIVCQSQIQRQDKPEAASRGKLFLLRSKWIMATAS